MGVYDVTTGITLRREVPEELRVLALLRFDKRLPDLGGVCSVVT